MPLSALPIAILTALHGTADAAEVHFEGFYRARARAFDTLSLARDDLDASVGTSEGTAVYAQHRLWLRPAFVLSEEVALYAEFRGLDNVVWGTDPAAYDPFVGTLSPLFEYGLTAPLSANGDVDRGNADVEGSSGLLDFTLWRAWGEVHTKFGRFTVGRVPLHWGLGIWLNDGVTVNPLFADYGDTTDRVMWEYLANNQIYVRAAVDIPSERLLGAADDTTSFNGAVAYRREDITAGLLLQFDRTNPERDGLGGFNLFTVDVAADVTLGTLHIAAEGVGHFGGGDFEDSGGIIEQGNVTALGAAAEVSLDADPWIAEVRAGFASGDSARNDASVRGYGFDRDYSVGMFLFEQPMPTLADGTGARDFSQVRSGTSIANAIFVAPTLRRRLADGLDARISYITGRTASGVQPTGDALTVTATNNAGYGHEFQIGLEYKGIDHLELDARAGLFLPGPFYNARYDFLRGIGPDDVGSFGSAAFGGQLTGRISF